MAREINFDYGVTGKAVYFRIKNANSNVYNGATFETPIDANVVTYTIPAVEQGMMGTYVANFPAVAAGIYNVTAYLRSGGTPAVSDQPIGYGSKYWDGSAECLLPAAAPTAEAIDDQLSDTHGSGHWGVGETGGGPAITDYPVTDAVTHLPVAGATVELYPTDDYSGIIDQQITDVLGHVTFSNLTSGTYYIKVIRAGYEPFYDSEVAA